jgi:protease I
MKRALIITWDKYQDHELIYPYYSAKENGFDVTLAASAPGKIFGILGSHMPCDISCDQLKDKSVNDYDLVILPGGVKALEKLRLNEAAVDFAKRWIEADKMTFVVCNGPQLLITAKVLSGRTISGYYAIEQDIINAGATYDRSPVVVDRNIVSCPHYDFMGEWLKIGYSEYDKQSGG